MSSFKDSGPGILHLHYMVPFVLRSIEQQKQFYNCERLHGEADELCSANCWNNSVTTTKYIEYINSIYGTRSYVFLSRGVTKVLLWRHNQKQFTAYQHFDQNLL